MSSINFQLLLLIEGIQAVFREDCPSFYGASKLSRDQGKRYTASMLMVKRRESTVEQPEFTWPINLNNEATELWIQVLLQLQVIQGNQFPMHDFCWQRESEKISPNIM